MDEFTNWIQKIKQRVKKISRKVRGVEVTILGAK